ncbi:ABC-2 type transport system ATP-binding protein [Ardenticatena maritima]|uniref:ABC transporter n=1 Tax=Ardenticatena maritima TaxID=872965 RepID=A0A0M8KAJ3_9CHLR|nr:ABC transporter ATP-binding protein [Ardenticatena maritima]KPL89354.1 ABC transporter [Ardenticatena maritima]GAP64251.1 ABC-2 type transport system ATP-binding protein [Ardenticatena maritima]
MTTATCALDVQHVRKVFEKESGRRWPWQPKKAVEQVVALKDVSLRVAPREIYGILGPNGSGKSTLIRCISTLLIPDAGTIRVFGHDVVREERIVKELINRVSVEASFFKKLSPMENLMFGARLYGLDAKEARREIIETLTRLGLEKEAIFRPMEKMSRGMQQKVAVARALLTRPRLLLLDEPTTGLDPRSKREVQAFVFELRDVYETTVVLTTHDMHEAERLCDRIAIIDRGCIVAEGTPAELKALVRQNGHEPTLEDVFMALTGRALSEEQEEVVVGGVA